MQKQILYEISVSIGNSLDLQKMLQESLAAYLRALDCSEGAVLEMRRGPRAGLGFVPSFSIPQNLSLFSPCQAALKNIPRDLSEASLPEFFQALPISGKDGKGHFFHLMELPGYGLLLLAGNGKELSPVTIGSLERLNRKLADSCLACLENQKIKTINEQLNREIPELRRAEAELKKALSALELNVEERTRELRESNEALTTANRQLNEIIEFLPDATSVIGSDGKVLAWNRAIEEMTGVSKADMIGKDSDESTIPFYGERRPHLPDLFDKSDAELETKYKNVTRKGGILSAEAYVPCVYGGKGAYVFATTTPLFDARGNRTGTIESVRDITEQKQAAEALVESQQRLSQIFDFLPDPTFAIDPDGKVIAWNHAMEEMTAVPAQDIVGNGDYQYGLACYGVRRPILIDLIFSSDEEVQSKYRFVSKQGDILIAESDVPVKGGEIRTLWGKARPLYDSTGNIVGAIEVIRDTTEQTRARRMLQQSEERYRGVIENIQDIFYRTDAHGKIILASPSAATMLGYDSLDEIRDMQVENLWMYPEERAGMLRRMREEGIVRDYELTLTKKDGSPLFVSVTSVFRKDEAGNILGVEGIVRDITERKRAEEERMRMATAVEQAAEAIIIGDTNWIIHYVNPAFERMSGYSRAEAIGQHMRMLKSGKHDGAFYRNIRATLSGGEAWFGRLINKKKNGALYEVEVTASPVRNSSGAIINYVTIHRDITQQVRLEDELRQAQKMEAIGTLAGGIAHDFNNILAAIVGYTEIAQHKLPEDNPIQKNLHQVLNASLRATELVKQILSFSRRIEQDKRPVQVAGTVKEALKLLRPSLPTTIEIRPEFSVSAEKTFVLADPTEIHQVLMNLCTNAAHAMRTNGGVLSVQLSAAPADSFLFATNPDLKVGSYVCLSVTDTGHGIEPAVLEKIFDPYFTTKGVGEGTGLGLSVAQGIIKRHGGAITVSSEPGKGTTFNVFLPWIEQETSAEEKASQTFPTGTERILFVDDEKNLAELGQELLGALGYQVVSKTDSIEALEAFRADPHGFDLIITDMTMPGLRGEELAKEIMAIRPDMAIVLCTGFSELIDEAKAKEMGIREFVMKPYSAADLARTIREVLDHG